MSEKLLEALQQRYHSPDEQPTEFVCRLIVIPVEFLPAVDELLSRLMSPDVWDENGIGAQESAWLAADMYIDYLESECP